MSDDQQKDVYVSKRSPSGWLFSVAGDTWADVEADLIEIFGEAAVAAAVAEVAGGGSNSIAEPGGSPPVTSEQSAEHVAAKLTASGMPPAQFETCKVKLANGQECGGIKDQWKPPTAKYKGFWGCNNFTAHPARKAS